MEVFYGVCHAMVRAIFMVCVTHIPWLCILSRSSENLVFWLQTGAILWSSNPGSGLLILNDSYSDTEDLSHCSKAIVLLYFVGRTVVATFQIATSPWLKPLSGFKPDI